MTINKKGQAVCVKTSGHRKHTVISRGFQMESDRADAMERRQWFSVVLFDT